MKKKQFEKPEAELIKFNDTDIIATSGPDGEQEDPYKEWEY